MTKLLRKQAKAERIEVRVTPDVKALLNSAAQVRHTTISDFLITNGIEAAERVISSSTVFYASEEGWAAIHKLLDEKDGVEVDQATVEWLTKRRRGE